MQFLEKQEARIKREFYQKQFQDNDNNDDNQDSEESFNKHSGSFHRQLRKQIKKVPAKPISGLTHSQKIRELFKRQAFKELAALAESDKSIYSEYDEIRINNHTLKLGQNALIKNAQNINEDFVGKILKIMTIKEEKTAKLICLCEIKWFYRKSEVIKYKPQAKAWISNSEVFTTTATDVIQASAIISSCSILSLEEYESIPHVDKNIFFTRMGWIQSKNTFDGFNKVKQHCTCKQPLNPDLACIQCDQCDEWYHMTCVGVKKGEYENKEYICGCCR